METERNPFVFSSNQKCFVFTLLFVSFDGKVGRLCNGLVDVRNGVGLEESREVIRDRCNVKGALWGNVKDVTEAKSDVRQENLHRDLSDDCNNHTIVRCGKEEKR